MQGKECELQKTWPLIVAKSWVDKEFKKRLLAHPISVFKEFGITPQARFCYKIIEESRPNERHIYISLPNKPSDANLKKEEAILRELGSQISGTEHVKACLEITARSWHDEVFRQRVIAHPAEVLREYGLETFKNVNYKVIVENSLKEHFIYLSLPIEPENSDLNEEDLKGISSGIWGDVCGIC